MKVVQAIGSESLDGIFKLNIEFNCKQLLV